MTRRSGADTIGRVKHSRVLALAAGGASLLAAIATAASVAAPSSATAQAVPNVPVTTTL